MEASTAGQTREIGFLSGYGAHLRALRPQDLTEHQIEMQDHKLADCMAIEGEDMAAELAAVVDLRTRSLVWSMIPRGDGSTVTSAPIPEAAEPDFVRGVITLTEALFPELQLPT